MPLDKSNSDTYTHLFRVAAIGAMNTGKTSALKKLCDANYKHHDDRTSTYGVEFLTGCLPPSSPSARTKLQLWDTAGNESHEFITQSYIRGSHILAGFFDASAPEITLQVLVERAAVAAKTLGLDTKAYPDKSIPLILVGSKADLLKTTELNSQWETANTHAKNVREQLTALGFNVITNDSEYHFIPVSAKTGEGIDNLLIPALQQATDMSIANNPNLTVLPTFNHAPIPEVKKGFFEQYPNAKPYMKRGLMIFLGMVGFGLLITGVVLSGGAALGALLAGTVIATKGVALLTACISAMGGVLPTALAGLATTILGAIPLLASGALSKPTAKHVAAKKAEVSETKPEIRGSYVGMFEQMKVSIRDLFCCLPKHEPLLVESEFDNPSEPQATQAKTSERTVRPSLKPGN